MWYNIDRRGHEYTCSATVVHAELLTLKSAIGSVPASTFEATNVELHELDTADKVMEHYLGLATQYLYAKEGSIVTLKEFLSRLEVVFHPLLYKGVSGGSKAFGSDVRDRMAARGRKFVTKGGAAVAPGSGLRSFHLPNTAMQPMADI